MAERGRRRVRPATTPEGRETQLVSMAYDLAERQMTEGTATGQVITHFLKLGSTREKLEQERIQQENLMLAAKIEQIASQRRIEELYADALVAMRNYAGQPEPDRGDDIYDD